MIKLMPALNKQDQTKEKMKGFIALYRQRRRKKGKKQNIVKIKAKRTLDRKRNSKVIIIRSSLFNVFVCNVFYSIPCSSPSTSFSLSTPPSISSFKAFTSTKLEFYEPHPIIIINPTAESNQPSNQPTDRPT